MLVQTKNGLLCGEEVDGISVFKGIPYAKPPVGDLRWKAPQPPENWEGIRDAKSFGFASVQPKFDNEAQQIATENNEPMSEDCLFLNIWAPKHAIEEGKRLPVLFIIHGGGFMCFSGSVEILQGLELAKKEIVVVTINYRLGAMGFFAHRELDEENPHHVSGNYGILDQIAALQWVQENIAAFGGDPKKVTISGESAGAFCVSVLCMSPLASGLFRGATAQSGAFMDKRTVMYQSPTLEEAEAYCEEACGGRDLAQLRQMTAEEIMKMTGPIAGKCLMPVWDGYVFRENPREVFKEGNFSDVPLLLGSNKDDGSKFTTRSGNAQELVQMAADMLGTEQVDDFLKVYPAGDPKETVRSQIRLFSDSAFGHNMYAWAGLQKEYGKSDVYLYYYCHIPPDTEFGSYHSSELYYFFHNLGCGDKNWTEKDYELQEVYSDYILNFVRNGNPNGNGLPEWKTFGDDPEQIMILDDDSHMERNPTLEAMQFWDIHS